MKFEGSGVIEEEVSEYPTLWNGFLKAAVICKELLMTEAVYTMVRPLPLLEGLKAGEEALGW